jgi:two-component system response regulator LytT
MEAKQLKIIIVEDEYPIALDTEVKLISKGYFVIGIAKDFVSLMELMAEDIPDVILLDINLGEGISGIDIAIKLKKIVSVPFVFLSAYSSTEIVRAALDTEPFGYLVKPYKIEDLTIAIELARSQWLAKLQVSQIALAQHDHDVVFVQSGVKLIRIEVGEILFLQALDNYAIIQTVKNKIVVNSYLSQLADNFKFNKNFFPVHRSYVINLAKINSIEGNVAYIDKFEIPISRGNKADLVAQLKLI